MRTVIAAVQPAFCDGYVLQIEVTHDDVCVYIKKGNFARTRIDTGKGFEENLLAASEKVREPQRG